jgi:CGNR zinc finger/Putative stress-induced transcription regulator
MTGETPIVGVRVWPEPGGRAPAPGALALVQAFMNTHYDRARPDGGETLLSADVLHGWLRAHQLIAARPCLDEHDLDRGVAVRQGLRALALANNGHDLDTSAIEAMRAASAGATSEIHLEPERPRLITGPDADINRAIGTLLAITAGAMIDATWPRLKVCPGRDCGWAFYDHSRNQSARWCSMNICGDREKARAYYQRKTAH